MSEKLSVKGFLNLPDFEIELKKFTVLIGPQAQGKSLVSRLVYFFRYVSDLYGESSDTQEEWTDYTRQMAIGLFEGLFPRYTWNDSKFKITYQAEDCHLSLEYGDNHQICIEPRSTRERGKNVNVFIPAGRIVFSTLYTGLYSFLPSRGQEPIINFDPLFVNFCTDCARGMKDWSSKAQIEGCNCYIDKISSLCKGSLHADKEEIAINKVRLEHCSSGQQEIAPMLMCVVWKRVTTVSDVSISFIVEEPEAHIFPDSQKELMELFASISKNKASFLLSTHSPYILTALNNLILAGETAKALANDEVKLAKLKQIVPESEWLNFDDVAVFHLGDGKIESMMNSEHKLIDARKLDAVSQKASDEFNDILELVP